MNTALISGASASTAGSGSTCTCAPRRADLRPEQRHAVADQGVELDAARLQRAVAEGGLVEQALDQQPRLRAAAAQHGEVAARLLVARIGEPIADRRRAGVDHHDRRQQLVRRDGREALDFSLLTLQLRDPIAELGDFTERVHVPHYSTFLAGRTYAVPDPPWLCRHRRDP